MMYNFETPPGWPRKGEPITSTEALKQLDLWYWSDKPFFTKEGVRDVAKQLDALKYDYPNTEGRKVSDQTVSARCVIFIFDDTMTVGEIIADFARPVAIICESVDPKEIYSDDIL